MANKQTKHQQLEMITFLPLFTMGFEPITTVALCAKALDIQRLNKQRVEAKQILDILTSYETYQGKWKNHPAVLMWRGCTELLKAYYNAMVTEWCSRGMNNTMPLLPVGLIIVPWWWLWEAVYYSHTAMLRRKDPNWYSYLTVPSEYLEHGYIWPSRLTPAEINRPLAQIADTVPDYLLCNYRCTALLKSGGRKGQQCYVLIKSMTSVYCGRHLKKERK